jgi:hypothetical protein
MARAGRRKRRSGICTAVRLLLLFVIAALGASYVYISSGMIDHEGPQSRGAATEAKSPNAEIRKLKVRKPSCARACSYSLIVVTSLPRLQQELERLRAAATQGGGVPATVAANGATASIIAPPDAAARLAKAQSASGDDVEGALVTFVIPTNGRGTLMRTLSTLQAQVRRGANTLCHFLSRLNSTHFELMHHLHATIFRRTRIGRPF